MLDMDSGDFDSSIRQSFGRVRRDMDEMRLKLLELETVLVSLRRRLDAQNSSLVGLNSIAKDSHAGLNIDLLNPNLSPAERKVVAVLSDSEIPLEYGEIAKRLNLNVITVRRYISNLTRYGIPLNIQKNLFNRNVVSLKKRHDEVGKKDNGW